MELKGKRELFAREYLKDLHGTNAALRAGYSPDSARTIASQLLAEPEVQARVAELSAARNAKLDLEARDILVELLRMLTTDIALALNADGSVKEIADIPIDLRRAIASIEIEEKYERDLLKPGEELVEDPPRDKLVTVRVKKIKFWSKEKAAELLGRHLVLFKDQLKVEGLGDVVDKILAARDRSSPQLV